METTDFEVDGDQYRLTSFGAREGNRVLTRAIGVFGGSIPGMDKGQSSEGATMQVLAAALRNLDGDTLDEICMAFAKKCEVQKDKGLVSLGANNGAVFDVHFSRRHLSMIKWLVQCFTFQYSDFLHVFSGIDLSSLEAKEPSE
jgi:hypothetical protein